MNDFELFFRNFVTDSDGEVLPAGGTECADYLFPSHGIIAELKTLENDARLEHAEKLQALVNDWMKRGLLFVFGRTVISLQNLPPVPQREWLQMMLSSIETIVRKANRQIRATKTRLARPEAKGVLLIANDGNFLHTNPEDYMGLIARVLAKQDGSRHPRFPHIDGVVYFSYRILSRNEGLRFWVAGQMRPGEVQPRVFQDWLRVKWLSHVAKTLDCRIVSDGGSG